MKKTMVLVAALAAASLVSGCAGFAFSGRGVPMGTLYADASSNEQVTENGLASKRGEACATSILGLVTTGDASVATAAKNGGITKVASVDHQFQNMLGFFAKYCVVVSGQ
jgi:hypothetical protein